MENARLHAEMEALAAAAERERVARELHDSLAQVLGYIRVKGLVALDALKAGDRAGVEAALE
jgi:nitrate/nitrite-specific signal transduction histidine kinase